MYDDLQRAAATNADAVLRRFFGADGRLKALPAKQSRQLAVYDLIAQRFVPGVRYTEVEVNRELMSLYDDYVTLRRGLIDFGLMARAEGEYWRIGGTVEVGGIVELSGATNVGQALDQPSQLGGTGGAGAAGDNRSASAERVPTQVAPPISAPSARGAARRERILNAAAELFAERGYAAVGMDDIGAAAGVTGPAIYRHFGAKASVLTAVFDRVIDAVAVDADPIAAGPNVPDTVRSTAAEPDSLSADTPPDAVPVSSDDDPAKRLRHLVAAYATAVSGRRGLMAVFLREVHHLPAEDRALLDERQRALIGRWRTLLALAHTDWDAERVRTAVHGAFGMLNAVGTFSSPLDDRELAAQLGELACLAMELDGDR